MCLIEVHYAKHLKNWMHCISIDGVLLGCLSLSSIDDGVVLGVLLGCLCLSSIDDEVFLLMFVDASVMDMMGFGSGP